LRILDCAGEYVAAFGRQKCTARTLKKQLI